MKTISLGLTVAVGSLFLVSCSDDDSGPSQGSVKLAVSTTSSSTQGQRIAAANDLVFTSGTITIVEVVFDGDTESSSVSRTIEQIADINYATGAVSPEVVVDVPAGDYTSVNLGIELQDDGSDPSVVIEGTYTNSDEVDIPIRFEFNSGEVFEANATSVTIEAGSTITGRITFDALAWFSTISATQLDDATLTDGTMIISATSNSTIFDTVADRLDIATDAVFE